MSAPSLKWRLLFGTALGIILAIDLLLVLTRPHEPSMKEAGLWVSFYIALALIPVGLLLLVLGVSRHRKPGG